MPNVLIGVLFIVGAAGATLLLYWLQPRRWSQSTRAIVSNTMVYLAAWGLITANSSLLSALGTNDAVQLLSLLLTPQQVVVLLHILRVEHRRMRAANEPAPADRADTSVADGDPAPPPIPTDRRTLGGEPGALRHFWAGDYALGPAFWGIATIGPTLAELPLIVTTRYLELEPAINENTYTVLEIASFSLFVLVGIYFLIGLLHSARRRVRGRHASGRRAFWARATQVYVYFGLLMSVVYVGGIGFIGYSYITVMRDHTVSGYALRVMRDGREMEITGGFRPGLARDVARLLRDNPAVRAVHLTSPGGQEREGIRLFRLIRRDGLETYSARYCASACTLAFVGGKERWIDRNAAIGFHSGAARLFGERINSLLGPLAKATMSSIYTEAGVDPGFIEKALTTPNESLLVPKPWELLAAKIASRVTGGGRFALSGLGSDPDDPAFSRALVAMFPILHALSGDWDDDYADLLLDITDGWRAGRTRDEITALVEDRTAEFAAALLADTDGTAVAEVVRLWADTFATLASSDPARCRILAPGRKNQATRLPVADLLTDRRTSLVRRLIVERAPEFHGMAPERLARGREALLAAMRRDLGRAVTDPLSVPAVAVDPAELCAAWHATLERAANWDGEIRLALAWRFGL